MLLLYGAYCAPTKRGYKQGLQLACPETSCIAKGKAHKKYALASKVSVASLSGSNVLVGISIFPGNPHGSRTLSPTLSPVWHWTGRGYVRVLVDHGYRGYAQLGSTDVIMPVKKRHGSDYALRMHKRLCKHRSVL